MKKTVLALSILSSFALSACDLDKSDKTEVKNPLQVEQTEKKSDTVTMTQEQLKELVSSMKPEPTPAPVVHNHIQKIVKAHEPKFDIVTKRVCEMKPVVVEIDVVDLEKPQERSSMGMIIGGVLGGLAGHQVGGGTGNTVATLAGAAGGAALGDSMANKQTVQQHTTHKEQRQSTVEVCHDEQVKQLR